MLNIKIKIMDEIVSPQREICKNGTANIGLCSFAIGPTFHRHRWSHRIIHWEWQIHEWSVFAVLILQFFLAAGSLPAAAMASERARDAAIVLGEVGPMRGRGRLLPPIDLGETSASATIPDGIGDAATAVFPLTASSRNEYGTPVRTV